MDKNYVKADGFLETLRDIQRRLRVRKQEVFYAVERSHKPSDCETIGIMVNRDGKDVLIDLLDLAEENKISWYVSEGKTLFFIKPK